MKKILDYLNGMSMYRLILYYLRVLVVVAVVLSLFGVLPYSWWMILIQVVLFVELCWGLNILFAWLFKVPRNYESQLITGIILALIAGPLSLPGEWYVIVVMCIAAMASKYLITINRSHIFNPAAFGAVASALLLGVGGSWWIGSSVLLPFILIGGLIATWKIKRFHLVLSFLAAYAVLFVLDALIGGGVSVGGAVEALVRALIVSPLFFFVFVMLVEPLTSPALRSRRIWFGVFAAVVLFVLQRFVPHIFYSLELSLLIANVFAFIVSPGFRQFLVLRRREQLSPSIEAFWFEPGRPLMFTPGQYLEYTLAHPKADDRGMRRWFTVASSPTEKEILIATRFADRSSTWKQALRAMKPGDTVVAARPEGDFVLPADPMAKLVFIAGGIGITPYRSMVKHLLDTDGRRDITLLYGVAIEADLVFRDIFEEATKQFGMKNVYALSDRNNIAQGWMGYVGFIDAELVKKEVPDFMERTFYLSGPETMVQAMEKVLEDIGVPKNHVRHDYFPGY